MRIAHVQADQRRPGRLPHLYIAQRRLQRRGRPQVCPYCSPAAGSPRLASLSRALLRVASSALESCAISPSISPVAPPDLDLRGRHARVSRARPAPPWSSSWAPCARRCRGLALNLALPLPSSARPCAGHHRPRQHNRCPNNRSYHNATASPARRLQPQ